MLWGCCSKKESNNIHERQPPRKRSPTGVQPTPGGWALSNPRKFRNLLESPTGNLQTEEVQEPSRRWQANLFVYPSPQSSARTGPWFFSTHSHPATAGYTKAETTQSTTRKILVLWWQKLSQGLNLTKMPKPSSHVTELKAHLVKGWGVGKAYLLIKTMTLHQLCWAVLLQKGMRPPLPNNIRK